MRRVVAIVLAIIVTTLLLLTLTPVISEALWRLIVGKYPMRVTAGLINRETGAVIVFKPEREFVSIWDYLRGVNPHYFGSYALDDAELPKYDLWISPEVLLTVTVGGAPTSEFEVRLELSWTVKAWKPDRTPVSYGNKFGSWSNTFHVPADKLYNGTWQGFGAYMSYAENSYDPFWRFLEPSESGVGGCYVIAKQLFGDTKEGYIRYDATLTVTLIYKPENKVLDSETKSAYCEVHYRYKTTTSGTTTTTSQITGTIYQFDFKVSYGTAPSGARLSSTPGGAVLTLPLTSKKE